jgi:sec-independent protein translocase protein TatA
MHAPGIWGIIIVAVVVLLLFGRGKISSMMGEVASGIKAFQKGLKEEDKPKTLEAGTPVESRETEKKDA